MYHPSQRERTSLLKLRIGLALCNLLCVAGCASAGPHAGSGDSDEEAALQQKIQTSIGAAHCVSDSQCHTIGLGANACGGPMAWRAWSAQSSGTGETLQAMADQLSALQRRRQTQAGMVSTCRYIPDPGATCQAQRCVLKEAADPAS